MHKIQPELARVRKRKEEILDHPEYSISQRNNLVNMLEEEANYHSAVLEIPTSGTAMGVTKSTNGKIDSPHVLKERVKEIWDWAVTEFNKIYRDNGGISERFLIDLNGKFEPGNLGYRNMRATLNLKCSLPNPAKVPDLMGLLVDQINNRKDLPLEQAIQTHFHITRIQPFNDGNKRTARMVQNLLLNYGGYFPIMVQQGERKIYMDLLEEAMCAFQERDAMAAPGANLYFSTNVSDQEMRFYSYLLSKEMVALDNIEKELAENRRYEVKLFLRGHPGLMHSTKNSLRGFFRKRNLSGQARLNKSEGIITVKGDISRDQVETILDVGVPKLKANQYEVVVKND